MFDYLRDLISAITLKQVLWGLGLFVATFAISLLVVGFIVVKMPSTFFLDSHPREWFRGKHPWLRWFGQIAKNLLGVVLIVLGVIQLAGPGQGLLTLLIGVVLLDFPGKRKIERRLVSQPRVLTAINRLRERFGSPPLQLEESSP